VEIFGKYKFSLQQFVTNCGSLQDFLDGGSDGITPGEVKLSGLCWDRTSDKLSTRKLHLNEKANTKRLILQTISQNFDLFGFNIPILNRCRLFMRGLQCQPSLTWDESLTSHQLGEWKNISRQVNAAPSISVERFVGRRDGTYCLLSFTDASKTMYGTVIYIQDLETRKVSFLMAIEIGL
jgi:hypothetical protein